MHDGKDLFEQATQHQIQGNYEKAEELYDMLLTQNHDNAGLLATVGTMYLQWRKPGLAMPYLHQAIEKGRLHQSDVLCNLGLAYKYSGQPKKALEWLKKASEVANPSAEALANYGGMFVEADEAQTALKALDKALKINPELALAHWNRSLVLLAEGDWEQGWSEYEWGFKAGMRVDRAIGGVPVWDGTPGKRVIVYGEQGIGDEIMFASMLPDMLKENEVILECHKRLKTLFQKSFDVTCYGTREDEMPTWPATETADARISIGSLGKFYRPKTEDCPGNPYLTAEPVARGNKFRVGISWTGGKKAGRIQKRTVPLAWWKSILANDCEFVSLQYTDCAEEIEAVERAEGITIAQPSEIKAEDYYETARIVASCDLVISVCTSVIHLAGALGVPCWVLTPNAPAWRYQNRGRMPWYRSVRLYRQPDSRTDAWLPVVERVGLDLSDLLAEKQRKAA